MMKTFYLIRHGETQWNREEIFRGRVDVPLNGRGVAQAGVAARALNAVKFAKVFSSPLQRARHTAEIIAPYREIITVAGFTDMDFGVWQGQPLTEVRAKFPGLYHTWKTQPQQARFPEGENLTQVRRRAVTALRTIVAREPGGNYLLVAHRVINKLLLCYLLGISTAHGFWRLLQDNCALNCFSWEQDSGPQIICLNQHLKLEDPALQDF